MSIEIKKAKIESGIYLSVEIIETVTTPDNVVTNEVSKKLKHAVHEDMITAFRNLVPHLAVMCEVVESNTDFQTICDMPVLDKLMVTGYSLGGDGDHAGITLIGQRKLKNNRVLNLCSPFIKFDDEHSPYPFDLWGAFCHADHEVQEYLNGKFAPTKQQQLELTT